MNKQQVIREILDAATESDLVKAEDALKEFTVLFKKWCDENEAAQEYARGRSMTTEELYDFFAK